MNYYLIEFPKCGRVWLRNLIREAMLLEFGEHSIHKNRMIIYQPKKLNIKSSHDGMVLFNKPKKYKREKIYDYPDKDNKVILLDRNPYDAMVSFYFYAKERGVFKENISSFIKSKWGINHFCLFYNDWYKIIKKTPHIIKMSYEDRIMDGVKELKKCFSFLSIEIRDEIIEKVVHESNDMFSFMRAHQKEPILYRYKKYLSKKDIDYIKNTVSKFNLEYLPQPE